MLKIEVGKLLAKHKLYDQESQKRAFWNLTYRCDIDYVVGHDARGRNVIPRFIAEDILNWEDRKFRTKPHSYCGPIIRKFNDYTFRNKITRTDNSPFIQEFYDDVDTRGTHIDDFMRKAELKAQIEKKCFILPDTTKPQNGQMMTKLQAIYDGERPFLRLIEADSVVNWNEIDGFMTEAVVLFQDADGDTFARYYDEQETIEIFLKPHGQWWKVVGVGEPIPHGFPGQMPLITVEPFKENSQIGPIAEVQQHITNILSLVNQELYAHTFTKTLLAGITLKDDEGDDGLPRPLVWGSNEIMTAKNKDITKINMGSDVNQTQMLLTVIGNEEENLYRTAGISMPQVMNVQRPESGIALAFKQNDLFVNLKAIADNAEAVENKILDMIYLGWGLGGEPGEVEYDDNFDEPDMMAEIAELQQLKLLGVPQVAYNNKLSAFIAKFFSLTDEEMKAVDAALAQAAASTDKDETVGGPDDSQPDSKLSDKQVYTNEDFGPLDLR